VTVTEFRGFREFRFLGRPVHDCTSCHHYQVKRRHVIGQTLRCLRAIRTWVQAVCSAFEYTLNCYRIVSESNV